MANQTIQTEIYRYFPVILRNPLLNLAIPGKYKLVKLTVNGEVKNVDGYILKLEKGSNRDYYYIVATMSIDGVGNNLSGSFEKKSIDAEGDVYKFSGAYSKLSLSGKKYDDGELIYPGIFKLKRIKFNEKFDQLTIIAPEKNTTLEFKRELPE